MPNVTDKEADELLEKYVYLREKCKTSKSKKIHLQYKEQMNICSRKFDYIVQNRAKRYKSFPNYDDLVQDGRLALMLALESYQLKKGSWFWWANQYVKTKLSREANKHSAMKIPIKHAKKLTPFKVTIMPGIIADDKPNAIETIQNSEMSSAISSALYSLPQTQRIAIEMYYEINSSDKHTIKSISERLSISVFDCKKLINEAKNSIRHYLENND